MRAKRQAVWRRALPSLGLFLVLLSAAGTFEALSQPTGIANSYLVSSVRGQRNEAASQALGEFRVVLANLLWMKVVDHYHHEYLATGGQWSKNESLLPLLHTIIVLDPHFIEAYAVMGGGILPKTGHLAQAHVVLDSGIKNNPDDYELYREQAILYAWTQHDSKDALPYAEKGLQQADDDFSRRIMRMLCHTLRDRARDENKTNVRTV